MVMYVDRASSTQWNSPCLCTLGNYSGSISQLIHTHVIKIGREPGAAHGYQSNLRGRAQLMRPCSAPHPGEAITASIGSVLLVVIVAALYNPQIRPFIRRTDDRIAVTWVAGRYRE